MLDSGNVPSRLAVTGAAGAIGAQVTRRLADEGYLVNALVRDAARVPPHPSVTSFVVDYGQPATLTPAFLDVAALVLIGSDGPSDRVLAHHRHILAAAADAGVGRIVLLSSQDADPGSPFCYAPVYADTEELLAASCSDARIVRAGLYTEFLADWLHEAARDGECAIPTLAPVAAISRADVAEALVRAVSHSGGSHRWTVTGPEPVSLAMLTQFRVVPTSFEEFRHLLIDRGTDPWWSYAFATLFQAIDEGRFAATTTDLSELTGSDERTVDIALK